MLGESAWREALPIGNALSIPTGHLPYGNRWQDTAVDYLQLRAEAVLSLIRQRFGGSYAAFAADFGIAPSTVSRWYMKGKGRKNIGEDTAREIEDKYGLERGALVVPDKKSGRPSVVSFAKPWPFPSVDRDRIENLSKDDRIRLDYGLSKEIAALEDVANADRKRSRR